jgi:capsular polysaccharide biosynthesis protein
MTARTSDVRWLLKDALRVVSKRKRLIFGLFLIVALGISVAVMSVPTSYEVAGKLVVTRERGDLLVTASEQRNFNYAVTSPTIQDMAVHAELLKNRSLIETVVKQLGLDRGADTSASEARLNSQVETILNGLTIQVVPNSNLIYVRYRSTDPVKGADIVKLFSASTGRRTCTCAPPPGSLGSSRRSATRWPRASRNRKTRSGPFGTRRRWPPPPRRSTPTAGASPKPSTTRSTPSTT